VSPDKLDVCIFRENMEDVYAGIEFPATSREATQIIELLESFGSKVRPSSAIGIKPVSEFGSKRLIKRAMQYAIDHKRTSVTLVHKGNIQKFTEGAFRAWGYELADDEFAGIFVAEKTLAGELAGQAPPDKIVLKDRITDAMFQELLIRPGEHSVIATTNLNGDYLSDAAAAQVGGLGIAPGANIGDNGAVFEAIHGTAPKYTDKDVINPTSVILSGAMMFQYLGWIEVHDLIVSALVKTFEKKLVTYDLERLMSGATLLKTSEFASAIVDNMVPN
jgi:isocitrate dehydrogenase